MLRRHADLPVGRPVVPAFEDRLVIREAVHVLPEVQVAPPAATVAAARPEILRFAVQQIAVGREVAVGVGPRPRHARRDAVARLQRRVVSVAVDRGFEVPARVELQRGLPVAEHVIGEAEPRVDVVIADDALGRRKDERLRDELRRPDLLRGIVAPGVVVADGSLDGELSASPLVLCVQGVVSDARVGEVRPRELRELIRHAVVDPVIEVVVVAVGVSLFQWNTP